MLAARGTKGDRKAIPMRQRTDAAHREGGAGGLHRPWPALALAATAVLLVLPVWLARMPAMPDYPAHLATFYLLAGGAKLLPLAQFYRVQWALVPNLASEAIVPGLAHFVGLTQATAIFLSFTIATWVLGAGAVHTALYRRVGIAPLFASCFVYNANFMWGFFNYSFGIGIALFALAAWIADEKRARPGHVCAFAVATLAIYFCHVFAAATLLLLIVCFEISDFRRPRSARAVLRRIGTIALLGLPAALAFFILKPKGGGGAIVFNILDTIPDRLSAAVQFTFDRPAWPLLAALTALFAVGVWRGKILVHPRMRFVLAALVLGCIFAPEWALGGWGVDLRLPAVLGTIAFASAEFRFERRTEIALLTIALAVAAWSAATVAGNWRYYDRRFVEFRAAAKDIEPGAKIVTVLDGDAMGLASDQPYWHMAEYEIIDRAAFTPLLFTTAGQHVIRVQPAVAGIAAGSAQEGSPPDISELDDLAAGNVADDKDIREVFPYLIHFQCHYDMAVVVHLGGHRSPVPDMLELRHAGSFFSLYRIRHEECGTQ